MIEDASPSGNAKRFLSGRKTLQLATTSNDDSCPTASHAPFVRHQGDLYVYLSAMSKHTKEIRDNRKVGAVTVEDQVGAFGREFGMERIEFSCTAEAVDKNSEEWKSVIELFKQNFRHSFGEVYKLKGFTLFRLRPYLTKYIAGFAATYRMNKELEVLSHVGITTAEHPQA